MLTTLALIALVIVAVLLWVSRNALAEGEQYDLDVAANKTGAVMIPDAIDWTDERNLERQEMS